MSYSKVSKTSPMSLSVALALTEPEAFKARVDGNLAYFNLLPKDCWKLKVLLKQSNTRTEN